MKLMTTHHLGQQPGRARLGACGHLPTTPGGAPVRAAAWAGNWRNPADAAVCPMNATTGAYVGLTTFEHIGSIKRPARHLRTRST